MLIILELQDLKKLEKQLLNLIEWLKELIAILIKELKCLSGISHDLRTPLTRLKLQLSNVKAKRYFKKMSKDIDEMEKMLNDYLQFAKTQSQENTTTININNLLNSLKIILIDENVILNNSEVYRVAR